MTKKPHYPYTYGDEGGNFRLSRKYKRLLRKYKRILFRILLFPIFTLLPENVIRQAVKVVNAVRLFIRIVYLSPLIFKLASDYGILPTTPVVVTCTISGVCLEKARTNVLRGKLQVAIGFVCIASFVMCYGSVISKYRY
jgi:hypothetical protein